MINTIYSHGLWFLGGLAAGVLFMLWLSKDPPTSTRRPHIRMSP